MRLANMNETLQAKESNLSKSILKTWMTIRVCIISYIVHKHMHK